MPAKKFHKLLVLALAVLAPFAVATAKPKPSKPAAAEKAPAAEAAPDEAALDDPDRPLTPEEEAAAEKAFLESLGFQAGPLQNYRVGFNATVAVPEEFMATDEKGSRKWLEVTKNLPDNRELATLLHKDDHYFIIFEFDDTGYVKDDDKDELDADKMLKNMRENQAEANKQLTAMGNPTLTVEGWQTKPHYDEASHNLEWAPILKSSDGSTSVNYNVRILGRRGVMEAQLIASPDQMEKALPQLREILKGFTYKQGEDYASFNASTDKIAEYGLAGLVAGGAVAVAAKSGLLGKLIKPIIIGIAALGAAIGKFFKKVFGGGGGGQA